jgi:hypothetical protein
VFRKKTRCGSAADPCWQQGGQPQRGGEKIIEESRVKYIFKEQETANGKIDDRKLVQA